MYENMIQLSQQDFDAMVKRRDLNFKGYFLHSLVMKGNLKNADFSGAKLLECQIQNANFSGAKFSECEIKDTDFQTANFSKCSLKQTEIEACNFRDTNWKDAYIAKTVFRESLFENCSFEKVYFSGGEFDKNVMMKDCNFARAYINSTCFDMTPENMLNPKNYETIKLVKGGTTKEEIENYKQTILQLMGKVQPDRKKKTQTLEDQEKRQEHERSI